MKLNGSTYGSYKDSGLKWIGDIPSNWELKKLKYVISKPLKYGANESGVKYNPSLPRYIRITDFSIDGNLSEENKLSLREEIGKNYLVNDGDLLFARSGATVGKVFQFKNSNANESSFAYAGYLIKASPNYDIITSDFLFYYTQSGAFNSWKNSIFIKATIENIGAEKYSNLKLPLPPKDQQLLITKFLNNKTAKINQAIEQKERMIELLHERKQIIIQNAITKGLDPNVKMKDSGVEWIGEIPKHWDVKRAKYIFYESDERSLDGSEELLSVSHMTGVTARSEKDVNMFKAEDYSGSKICRKGDLVYNIMWAWMGALGVSNEYGIVSPSYAVYRALRHIEFNGWYIEELLKSKNYVTHYNQVSTGLHSSRLRFYSRMFFNMEIGFPDFDEQNEIEKEVKSITNKIENAIYKLSIQIEKLKEYKTTLIDHAVTGKIKVS